MLTISLAAVHAADWMSRYDGDAPTVVRAGSRIVRLELDDAAAVDALDDARHYVVIADELDPEYAGLVSSARANIRRLEAAGVTATRFGRPAPTAAAWQPPGLVVGGTAPDPEREARREARRAARAAARSIR
ncbi:hypothetical protein [Aeromicrobium sp. Leaf291]|uniref:hypothetical protein n=1 Tax=Aeromicrobium sp. Leaf291 TaxID=1736325 RepID=UPI0006FC5DDA|nr:hypothetical protein [Aeromicrobium sp. Leaf291]KQP81586.1 hypothetical protein ASF35_16275 [Aeromicrobium sp. Leaf291]